MKRMNNISVYKNIIWPDGQCCFSPVRQNTFTTMKSLWINEPHNVKVLNRKEESETLEALCMFMAEWMIAGKAKGINAFKARTFRFIHLV